MLREGFDSLDSVVYTHEHKDHLAGMDDVRPFNYIQKQALTLHASARVEKALKRDFHYAFDENKHGGVPNVTIERVKGEDHFMAGGMTWQPLPVMHGALPIHGFRVEDVAYITDANDIPDATLLHMQNLEVLVLNALRPNPHYSHFSHSRRHLRPQRKSGPNGRTSPTSVISWGGTLTWRSSSLRVFGLPTMVWSWCGRTRAGKKSILLGCPNWFFQRLERLRSFGSSALCPF